MKRGKKIVRCWRTTSETYVVYDFLVFCPFPRVSPFEEDFSLANSCRKNDANGSFFVVNVYF